MVDVSVIRGLEISSLTDPEPQTLDFDEHQEATEKRTIAIRSFPQLTDFVRLPEFKMKMKEQGYKLYLTISSFIQNRSPARCLILYYLFK